MDRESLYHRLPICVQDAVCSFVGWRIQRSRFGESFRRHLVAAEQRQQWPLERLLEFRDQRLRQFVRHAAATVPYYQSQFREGGIDPERIRTIDDLQRLPLLSKTTIQQHLRDFISTAVSPRTHRMVHTSGTTGAGLRFPTTLAAIWEQWAVWWRFRRRHGIRQDMWCGYFGGRSVVPVRQTEPPYWRTNWPGRQFLFSGYHLSAATAGAYIDQLNRCRPPWLHGYPSALALLADQILRGDRPLEYCPTHITVGAENLHIHQSATIEKAFGVRPWNNYGMTEATANISECIHGRLHVDEDIAALEFLPMDGRICRIVGTNFTNYATPFLRYDVGDLAEMDDTPCECGLAGRTVRAIDGRAEDYVILRNGARVGRMDHIFKDMTTVREAQIVQGEPGELTVRVSRNPGYSADDEAALQQSFHKFLGDQARIHLEYVERIPRSKSGKFRFVVSQESQAARTAD